MDLTAVQVKKYLPALEDDVVIKAHSPFTRKSPKDLKWINLNFQVGDKKILSDCWGHVPAGKTCAIMGASGAGKSSLLNVLAGRSGKLTFHLEAL